MMYITIYNNIIYAISSGISKYILYTTSEIKKYMLHAISSGINEYTFYTISSVINKYIIYTISSGMNIAESNVTANSLA